MFEKEQKSHSKAFPVFIVGMNGSGTTMLAECLNNHPKLYIFPQETRILPYLIIKKSSFGDLSTLSARRKLADALGRSWAFWYVNDRKPVILSDFEISQPGFSEVINSMFLHFATAEKKIRWGEKSPMYLQHIGLLANQFPQAQFIHIYRDGRDVAQSFHRRYLKEPRWTIYRWKKILKMGRSQGQQIGPSRYMEICYETLTSDPENNLTKICEFLGLQYHPVLCKTSSRHMEKGKDVNFIVSNSNKWKNYFTKKEIIELESIAGAFLTDLGYIIESEPGSKNPHYHQLLLWKFYDHLRTTWTLFRKRGGIGFIPIYLRKALYALRQSRTNYY